MSIEYIGTNLMIIDLLMKGLPPKIFIDHGERMSIIDKSLLINMIFKHVYTHAYSYLAHMIMALINLIKIVLCLFVIHIIVEFNSVLVRQQKKLMCKVLLN